MFPPALTSYKHRSVASCELLLVSWHALGNRYIGNRVYIDSLLAASHSLLTDSARACAEPQVEISQPRAARSQKQEASSETSVDLHPPAKLLVLVADELDELGVRHDLLVDANRERFRVRLRIVNRDVDLEPAEGGPVESFREFGLLAVRTAADVEPAVARSVFGAAQVVRLDDERVAV